MLALLALAFIVVPIAELFVLFRLGREIGLLPTLALVLFTGFAGAVLARAQGLRTLRAMQREMLEGRVPGREILDGLAVLVGGALLLTPGLITDLMGLALLFPPTRRVIQGAARRWLERATRRGTVRVSFLGWGPVPGPGEERRYSGLDPRHEIRVPPPDETR